MAALDAYKEFLIMSLVTFEDPTLGSVADELRGLGHDFIFWLLKHCQAVETGARETREFQVFHVFEGINMFRAIIDDKFAIYAVEDDWDASKKLSIMLAGRLGAPIVVANHQWDGRDETSLRSGILDARASAYFR